MQDVNEPIDSNTINATPWISLPYTFLQFGNFKPPLQNTAAHYFSELYL